MKQWNRVSEYMKLAGLNAERSKVKPMIVYRYIMTMPRMDTQINERPEQQQQARFCQRNKMALFLEVLAILRHGLNNALKKLIVVHNVN